MKVNMQSIKGAVSVVVRLIGFRCCFIFIFIFKACFLNNIDRFTFSQNFKNMVSYKNRWKNKHGFLQQKFKKVLVIYLLKQRWEPGSHLSSTLLKLHVASCQTQVEKTFTHGAHKSILSVYLTLVQCQNNKNCSFHCISSTRWTTLWLNATSISYGGSDWNESLSFL